jgi:hypothetical protein
MAQEEVTKTFERLLNENCLRFSGPIDFPDHRIKFRGAFDCYLLDRQRNVNDK